MKKELNDFMEKDDVEYVLIDSINHAFEKITFKEIKEKQVPAKIVVDKLIECRDAINQNENLNKLNYTNISFDVFPYILTLSDNVVADDKIVITNNMFVHDDLIGLRLYDTANMEIEYNQINGYELCSLDDFVVDEILQMNHIDPKNFVIPHYNERYIVSISDLKNELEKNNMSFESAFDIKEILKYMNSQQWYTIILDKSFHIGNSLSEDDIIEYLSSSAKQQLDMAYSFNMPYICEKAFASANKKEKKLMVIDILTNGEENLDSFMEEAKNFGALDKPIYIMGYSLKDYVNGNEKQEKILSKLGHNHDYPEVKMTEEKRKVISNLFKTKEVSEEQRLNFIVSEFQKIKKSK